MREGQLYSEYIRRNHYSYLITFLLAPILALPTRLKIFSFIGLSGPLLNLLFLLLKGKNNATEKDFKARSGAKKMPGFLHSCLVNLISPRVPMSELQGLALMAEECP